MKNVKELHQKWMQDPQYKKEYDALDDEFNIARSLIEARAKAQLTRMLHESHR